MAQVLDNRWRAGEAQWMGRWAARVLMLTVAGAVQMVPATALGDSAQLVSIHAGGQIGIEQYRSAFKLAGVYGYRLGGAAWLDGGLGVLVLRETNLTLDGGVCWRFGMTRSGVRAFVRTDLELGFLFSSRTKVVLAPRVGGGAAYYSTPGWGATLEANLSIGPAFGDGVHVAAALDIMLGVEFPF